MRDVRNPLKELWGGYLGRMLILLVPILLVVQQLMSADFLIDLFNALTLSMGCGVMVTYASDAYYSLTKPHPTRSDFLCVGVFLSWTAVTFGRLVGIMYRNFNLEVIHTDWVGGWIALSFLAGILHLNAPKVIEDRVPAEQWRVVGWFTFAGVFIFCLLVYLREYLVS